MRRLLLTTIAALAVFTLHAQASLDTTLLPDLIVSVEGTLSPKALSKTAPTPASLVISGKVHTASGEQPPALQEITIEGDRSIAFDTEGVPVCRRSRRDLRDPTVIQRACSDAVIGRGRATVSVELPGQAAISTTEPLLLLNGGQKGRVTTLFGYLYLTRPITTEIVIPVKVQRTRNGRYGIESVASIPMIAGGAGSVTDFRLRIERKYAYEGKRRSVLGASCVDGKLKSTVVGVFADHTKVKADVINACTPRE